MNNRDTKKLFANNKGITLIELVIVMAVIGIITAISWETLGGTKDASKVENACNSLASVINKTRSHALTGKCSGNGADRVVMNLAGPIGTIKDKDDDPPGREGVNCDETFNIQEQGGGGVSCGDLTLSYSIPDGNASFVRVRSIRCNLNGINKYVCVTPYKAECKSSCP